MAPSDTLTTTVTSTPGKIVISFQIYIVVRSLFAIRLKINDLGDLFHERNASLILSSTNLENVFYEITSCLDGLVSDPNANFIFMELPRLRLHGLH